MYSLSTESVGIIIPFSMTLKVCRKDLSENDTEKFSYEKIMDRSDIGRNLMTDTYPEFLNTT